MAILLESKKHSIQQCKLAGRLNDMKQLRTFYISRINATRRVLDVMENNILLDVTTLL